MVMINLEDNVVIHLDYEKHRLLLLDFGFDYIVYTLYDEEHRPHIIDLDDKVPITRFIRSIVLVKIDFCVMTS